MLEDNRHCRIQRRHFGKRRSSGKRRRSNIPVTTAPPITLGKQGPNAKDVESKFPLPNAEKEKELARMQDHVRSSFRAGDYSAGLKDAKRYLKAAIDHFGRGKRSDLKDQEHPAIGSAYSDLGLFYKLLGNFDESRRQYKSALTIYGKVLGKDHGSYASLLHNLGNLSRTQVHVDADLRATDRLTLIEEAAEVLEQAYKIRLEELGPNHPHTVASRSSWGATLATQILQYYKKEGERSVYIPVRKIQATEWELAQEHLRLALSTAIENPRGPGLSQNLTNNTKTKPAQQSKKNQFSAASAEKESASEPIRSIQTLSAASAAQNLAIFLKARATTVQDAINESNENATKEESDLDGTTLQSANIPADDDATNQDDESKKGANKNAAQAMEWFQEAHGLYTQVLELRKALLPKGHPDMYATQHSLAELLQAMGDEEAANVLRQEIIDTYDPPKEGETENGGQDENHETVVVEKSSTQDGREDKK